MNHPDRRAVSVADHVAVLVDDDLDDPHLRVLRLPAQKFHRLRHGNALPATVPPRAAAMEALRLMQDGGFDHVPVVQGGRAVGVVSHRHFLGIEQTRLEDKTRTFETLR